MKIAYLILCHTDPQHIRRLVKKITEGTAHEAFVHVDAKCDITEFQACLENIPGVHLLRERTKVFWGGIPQLKLQLA